MVNILRDRSGRSCQGKIYKGMQVTFLDDQPDEAVIRYFEGLKLLRLDYLALKKTEQERFRLKKQLCKFAKSDFAINFLCVKWL